MLSFFMSGRWIRGFNLFSLCGILLLISIAYLINVVCNLLLKLTNNVLSENGETVMRLLYSFVRYVTVIAVFYFGLGYLGFSTGTIIASLGILDIPSGKLTAVNAGHEYPVLKTPEGMYELIKDKHGIAVGIMEGAKYREYEWELTPGSSLFVYTDGLPEANNAEEKLYGVERMLAALNGVPEAGPEELLKSVRASVDAFVGEAPQFDDLTMLCLRYHGTAK